MIGQGQTWLPDLTRWPLWKTKILRHPTPTLLTLKNQVWCNADGTNRHLFAWRADSAESVIMISCLGLQVWRRSRIYFTLNSSLQPCQWELYEPIAFHNTKPNMPTSCHLLLLMHGILFLPLRHLLHQQLSDEFQNMRQNEGGKRSDASRYKMPCLMTWILHLRIHYFILFFVLNLRQSFTGDTCPTTQCLLNTQGLQGLYQDTSSGD